jgi:hypothetical protein
MMKRKTPMKKKHAATARKRVTTKKLKRSPRKRASSKKVMIAKTYPLFRRQKGVIKLRVPGAGPVNEFDTEHSKKEGVAKRAVRESNEEAWMPTRKSA